MMAAGLTFNVIALLLIVLAFVVVTAVGGLLVYLVIQTAKLRGRIQDLEHALRRLLDDRQQVRPTGLDDGSTDIMKKRP